MNEHDNPRFRLRAYEQSNCVRLCAVLWDLCAQQSPLTTDAVAQRWAARWPQHHTQTGRKAIRARIGSAAPIVKAAGIAQRDGTGLWEVLNTLQLVISASNLPIVTDPAGLSVPPGSWVIRPAVPEDLLAVQEELISRPATAT